MSNRVAEHASLTTGSVVRILYVNGSGQTSERSISVKGRFTSREGVTYLRAFCHLRQEERVFRTDRVLGILDEQTEHAATRDVPERDPVFRTPLHGYPMNTCPAQTEPARNEANRPVKRRVRRGFFGQLIVLAVLTFAVLLAVEDRFPNITIRDRLLPPTRTARSAASTATHEPSSKREEPPVVPPDATWYDTYRGHQFKADRVSGRVSYTHLQTGVRFADAHSLRVTVNESILGAAWSIESPDLTRMFGDADSNRDGWLSWGEIKQFQRWLWNTYRYLSNAKALT
ncbi:MAG: WYL domain-containing protein, partial [Spirochaetota bacterium]